MSTHGAHTRARSPAVSAPTASSSASATPSRLTPTALRRLHATSAIEHALSTAFPRTTFALGGVSLSAARQIAAEVATLGQRYPAAMRGIRLLGVSSDPRGARVVRGVAREVDAETAGFHDTGGVVSRFLGRGASIVLMARDLTPAGQRSFNEAVYEGMLAARGGVPRASYIVAHEFGHALERALARSRDPGVRSGLRTFQQHARAYAADTSGRLPSLSGYAALDPSEAFAEAFAASRYGPPGASDHPLVREQQALLQRAYGTR